MHTSFTLVFTLICAFTYAQTKPITNNLPYPDLIPVLVNDSLYGYCDSILDIKLPLFTKAQNYLKKILISRSSTSTDPKLSSMDQLNMHGFGATASGTVSTRRAIRFINTMPQTSKMEKQLCSFLKTPRYIQ